LKIADGKSPHRARQDAGRVSVLGRLFAQARPGLAQAGFGLAPPPGINRDEAGLPDASHRNYGEPNAKRKPILSFRLLGWFLLRIAQRRLSV